ncbi:MAG: RNA-directed DNA polymerase [Alphaproteobacteria bacterium]
MAKAKTAETDSSTGSSPNISPVTKSTANNVLKLSHSEAKSFFLKGESYSSFGLPPYFKFDQILSDIDVALNDKNLSDFFETVKFKDENGKEKNKADSPKNHDEVNHKILNNKDGKYAWRPMQLIHPALYVSLAHKITDEKNWEYIQQRFAKFYQNQKIECMSLPIVSSTDETDKAAQVSHWWHEVEQKSIVLALDYEHVIHADLSDCYGSIYTHSIAWALHDKKVAKENRSDLSLIGNQVDRHLQDMSNGQTNGIPQGSALMDFVAEMVLGYADFLLSEKIKKTFREEFEDYHIIRYRDDYRVFTNSTQDGEKIIKLITETMIELGLKLNQQKTKATNQVVSSSIKSDKLYWIGQKQSEKNLQKHLLIIHELSNKFQNSGSLPVALDKFYKRILSRKKINEDIVPLISIVVDISYHNPRTYPIAAAILSKFFSFLSGDDQKRAILKKIEKRFANIPNTGHLMIWLQRISLTFDKDYEYEEPVCQIVTGKNTNIWNSDWLKDGLKRLIDPSKIIDKSEIEKLSPVIRKEEVELFKSTGEYYW